MVWKTSSSTAASVQSCGNSAPVPCAELPIPGWSPGQVLAALVSRGAPGARHCLPGIICHLSVLLTSCDCCVLPEQGSCQPGRECVSGGNGAVTRAGAEHNVDKGDHDTSQHQGSSFDFVFPLELLQLLLASVWQHSEETIKTLGWKRGINY